MYITDINVYNSNLNIEYIQFIMMVCISYPPPHSLQKKPKLSIVILQGFLILYAFWSYFRHLWKFRLPFSMVYMTVQKDNKLQKGVKIHQLVILVQYTRLFSDILPSVETPGFSSPVLCVCLWR